ncbi:type II toxin-antitoxin system VapC family toxin [Sandaracinobacteroides saxicola]|uniref:Ribonuclease VapC n=1 Tax=Sandaracinobacteroides saxicola TaxID=2759707 RepID=A0A7G5IIX9_9SPHN|nr:type II toxin-antitoxin system VapC family toxin [Sandaracinobacteroides saxicola]QMW23321.1 type II toxin-antitoxin system VapC family toxin [Sandaracinobacteroides saxicola]
MTAYVLDTSAVLALVLHEPGGERVVDVLEQSVIDAVNLAEVVTKLNDAGYTDDTVRASIAALGLTVLALDGDDAIATGLLRTRTRARGLSLGDRACLARAASLDAVALTADRAWADMDIGVKVEMIR